ncbi:MAG: aspartyl protease family protein, partial [Sporomusa sp.]
MKNKIDMRTIFFSIVAAALFSLSSVTALAAPLSPETSAASAVTPEAADRGDYLQQLTEIERKYQRKQNDQKLAFAYAEHLFALGEFSKSQQILKPLLAQRQPVAKAIYLSARIEYLTGNYAQAEKLYGKLVVQYPNEFRQDAELGLLYTYYQTNQYQKAQNLFKGADGHIELPLWEMMKDFGNTKPYQIDWHGKQEAIIPFINTKKSVLPVVSVEINGKPINCFIDTGCDSIYLDAAVAASVGITSIAQQEGVYAGGKTAVTSYGIADSLTMNGVTVKSIPVSFGPDDVFDSDELVLGGIIGTNVLQQFLSTIDYPGGQLILRSRNQEGRAALNTDLAPYKQVTELPFALAATHLMISQGSVQGKDKLNFLVDSGLDDSVASVLLPRQTMDYAGITMPALDYDGGVGLGGAVDYVGRFAVDTFRLG